MTSPSHNDDDDKKQQPPKVRVELPYLFEKELTVKQNKRIYIVEEFAATERGRILKVGMAVYRGIHPYIHIKVTPIEGKFYSKFNDANIKDIAQRQYYWKLTEEHRNESRTKQGFPILESQTYGWIPKSVSVMALKRINYVQAPKRRCSMTVYGEKLSCERVTERPKFTGERFYLR